MTLPKKKSPTQSSLDLLAERGYTADIVERRLHSFVTKDWGGFADILACRDDETVLVQTTSGVNFQARFRKIMDAPAAKAWCNGRGRGIELHGWRWLKPRGGKREWTCRIERIAAADFTEGGE